MRRAIVWAACLAAASAMATESATENATDSATENATENATASLLPEGSADIAVGAMIATAPSFVGSATRQIYLLPRFSAAWSNGIFLDGLTLGMQLSSDPLLEYGPLIALDLGGRRSDGSRGGMHPVFGAFVSYQPFRELALGAELVGRAGIDGRGVLAVLRTHTQTKLSAHQSLTTGAGLTLADASYMRSTFGTARYQPAGGVRDVFADTQWHWQMSRKFALSATLRISRLQGRAAASARVERRTGVSNSIGLSYSY